MRFATWCLAAIFAAGGKVKADSSHDEFLFNTHARDLAEENDRRLMVEGGEFDSNIAHLKQQYYEFHAKVLSDEMIEDALAKAREEADAKRFGPDDTIYMQGESSEFDRQSASANVVFLNDIDEEHPDYHKHRHLLSRRTQISRDQNLWLVAGNSPGWTQNRGRNEFFCVSLYSLDNKNYLPLPGEPLTLRNCYTTPSRATLLAYEQDFSIRTVNDNFYYNWCVAVDKADYDELLRIDTCNFFDPNQTWNLFGGPNALGDRTWRPGSNADLDLCVTSQENPSEGGKLYLDVCDTQYQYGRPPLPANRLLGQLEEHEDQNHQDHLGAHLQSDNMDEGAIDAQIGERDLGSAERRHKRAEKRAARRKRRQEKKWAKENGHKKDNNKDNKYVNKAKRQPRYAGGDALRMRQVWVECEEISSCYVSDIGAMNCDILTACKPSPDVIPCHAGSASPCCVNPSQGPCL